ncbi:hypothetical protein CC79DRAFT_1335231 [Sarocladium strictum]
MARNDVPQHAWNCHMHCLEPERVPFKATRAYTPQPATLESLMDASITDNVVIVQATIENGHDGVVAALERYLTEWPNRIARGVVLLDESAPSPLHTLNDEDFGRLHALGVRSVRVHGAFGTAGSDPDWVIRQFYKAAQLVGVSKYGWSISAQLPLQTWASITDTLLNDAQLSSCTFLLDHNGSATPNDVETDAFAQLGRLLSTGRAYVKVGALHRRSPEDIGRMQAVVQTMAKQAPRALVWGSDWPHCNSKATGSASEPAPPLAGVDTGAELEHLRSWLTDEQWTAMMVDNPNRLFL